MLTVSAERDHGDLVIRQHGLRAWRRVLGVPLLAWGVLMAVGVATNLAEAISGGDDALTGALGAFLLGLFAALILPLGWWLTLATRYVRVTASPRAIVEISDWRVGEHRSATPVTAFHAVRVATEYVDETSRRGAAATCVRIRLLPHDPATQPSIEVAFVDPAHHALALDVGRQLAAAAGLALEAAPAGRVMTSPARALEDRELAVLDASERGGVEPG